MSYSFKIVLDKRYEKDNNTHPLKLRIYQGAQYKEKSLGIFIRISDWDDNNQVVLPSVSNFRDFNSLILSKKTRVQKAILLAEINDDPLFSFEELLSSIFTEKPKRKEIVKSVSIIKYGEELVKSLIKSGRVGNAFVYNTAIVKLKTFTGTDDFSFEDLTYKKLNEFQETLSADGIKVNSISVYMRTIRAIYNRAIKEGIVPTSAYPFAAYRVKNEKTVNRTLTLKEMQSIVRVKLVPESPIWHWRNCFLLSFCFIGVNFADLLTLRGKDVVDGRIVYRRKKTGKIYSIRMQTQAIEILGNYCDLEHLEKDELLLPFLKQTQDLVKLKKDTWQSIKTCNEYMVRIAKMEKVGINKEISSYYARYTWANIARSLGQSKDVIGQALGHSYGNSTTSIYLDDFDNEIIDNVNKSVLTKVFGTLWRTK